MGRQICSILDQKQGVENHGTLEADRVRLSAGDMFSILLDQPSHIKADRITVEGGAGSMVQVAGTLDASNYEEGGVGGRVEVLGEYIALDDVLIDASGDVGGGDVLIGGDFQGKGDIRNAARTLFGADAEVRADAISNGHGGRVIVWANEVTGFYGSIQARGGGLGGNGGFVETSGKDHLIYRGSVDTSSPLGQAGTLLLDPKNIVIENVSPAPNDTIVDLFFSDTPSDLVTLDPDDVVSALEANAILTLQANNDITVNDEVDATDGGQNNAGDLILQAGRSIFINDRVAVEGSITLTANDSDADSDFRDLGLGVIDIADNSASTGGSLEIDQDLSDTLAHTISLEIEPDMDSVTGSDFTGGDIIMGDLAIRAFVSASNTSNTNRQVIISVPEGNISTANGASSVTDTTEVQTDGSIQLTAMGMGGGTAGTALTVVGDGSPLEITDTGAGEIRVDELVSGGIRDTTINVNGVAFGDVLVNYGVNGSDTDVINISNGDGATEIEFGPTLIDHDFTFRSTGAGGDVGQLTGTTYRNTNAASTTTFDVGPNNLELDNENNNFAGDVLIAAGGDATLATNNTALALAAVVGGTLTVQTPAQIAFSHTGPDPVTLSADSVILSAATGVLGAGSLSFGPDYQIQANMIELRAGDGIGTNAFVNAQASAPEFRNRDDATQLDFNIIQDGRITSDIGDTAGGAGFVPLATQFTLEDGIATTPVTMTLESTNDAINLASPTDIADASLTVRAANGVTFEGGTALTLASLDVNDVDDGVNDPTPTQTTLKVPGVTTSTGGQRYTGAVVLDTNVILSDSADTIIEVTGPVSGANDLTLGGGGAFTFSSSVDIGEGTGASLSIDTGGTTTFESTVSTANAIDHSTNAGTVVFQDDVTVADGNSSFGSTVQFNATDTVDGLTFLQSDGSVTFGTVPGADAVTIAGGPATIQTLNGVVTLNSTVDATVDDLQSLTVDSGAMATNINAPIGGTTPLLSVTLIADNMDLTGALITTQTGVGGVDGVVTLQPSTNGRAINLGEFLLDTSTELGLSEAEFSGITAPGGLAIGINDPNGPVSTGQISITEGISLAGGVTELRLSTGAGISVLGGSVLTVDALAVDTVASIDSLPAEVNRLAARSTSGSITISSTTTDPLTIDTVAGLPGLSTEATNQTITLSNAGVITVNAGAAIDTNDGNIEINATGLVANATISADTGDVLINADDLEIGASIDGGLVQFVPATDDRPINLGTETALSLSLTDAELDRVTTTNGLAIGINDPGGPISAGEITISDNINLTGNSDELRLSTGAGITVAGGSLTVNALAVDTVNSINGLPADVSRLAARSTSGSITIESLTTDPLTIDTVAGLPGLTTTTAGQTITLSNAGAITVNSGAAVTTNDGNVQISASDFAANALINAGTGNVLINADDLEIGASIDGGLVQFVPATDGRPINLGTETALSLSLTDAELDRVTTTNGLAIGINEPGGPISAGEITISDNINLTGNSDELRLSTGAGITVDNGSLTVNELAVDTVNSINGLPADVSRLAARSTNGSIAIESLTTNPLVIDTVAGLSGLTTTASGQSITLSNVGAVTVNAGAAVNANNGDIQISASDVVASAAIGAGTGDVLINADNLEIGASIDGGLVQFFPTTPGRLINLGTETIDSLSLTDAELDQVGATDGLSIGINEPGGPISAGEITISSNINLIGDTDELRLSTGAGITEDGGTLTVQALALDTVDSINGLPADVDRLAARSTSGSITISSTTTDPLTIDTVAELSGLATTDQDITVSNAGAINILSGADVSAGAGDVLINADDLAIDAPIDGRLVRLSPTAPGRSINLGTETAGSMSLTGAELDQIVATGTLEIGNDPINGINAGQITISDSINLDPGSVSSLVLSTATTITPETNTTISVNSLGLSSNGAIGTDTVPFVLDGVDEVAATSQGEVHLQRTDTATGIGNLTVTTVGENDGVQVVGVSSNSNPISIDVTTGDLTISDPVDAGTASVTLTATGSLDSVGDVIASELGLSAGTGIGSAGTPFEVTVGTLAARSTGATGDIFISKEGDLTIAQVGTIPGLDVLDGNTISVTTTSVIDGEAGNLRINAPVNAPGTDGEILLNAGGDLAINALVDAPGTNGEIVLTANNDLAINQSLNAQGTNGQILATAGGEIQGVGTLSAENIGLDAGTDIGLETSPIQLVAANVAAVSQSGTIQLQNQGELSIGQVNGNTGLQANGTDQQIRVLVFGGDLVVDQQIITTGTGGEVRLIAPSGSITGGGTVTADRVGMLALSDIRQDAQNNNPLQLNVSAVGARSNSGGVINLANTGDLEIADVAGFTGIQSPNNGSVTVSVTGGSLDVTQSVNAGEGSVVLETDATGAITGVGGVTAAEIALTAGTGIGSEGTPFAVEAVTVGVEPGTLAAETTASTGDIFLTNTGDLKIADVGGVTGLSVLNNAAEGNIISVATTAVSGGAAGDLVVDSTINAGNDGEIRLGADGSINGSGAVSAGGVSLSANSDIGQQISPIQLSTANIAAVSQSGTIQLQNQGDLSIAQVNGLSGLQVNAIDRQISVLVLGGGLVLDQQVTTNTGGEVRLTVPTGSITGGGTITAGGAGLVAGSHIRQDANNALQLNVSTLGARIISASTDEIHLTNAGDLEVTEVAGVAGVNAAAALGTGKIELTVDGSLTLTDALVSANSAEDAIRLSVSGAILDGGEVNGADIQSGANGGLFLEQAMVVGSGATNPIETSVDTLTITPAVDLTVGETSIHNEREIAMQAIDVDGDLRVTTQTGNVTDTEAIDVAGTATFGTEDAAGSVTLTHLNTGQIDGLAFDTQGNADVTTADTGELVLRASTIGGSGSVTTIESDELVIEGLLTGSGNLNLRPKNNAADILIGGVDDSSGTGDYHLGTSDVANIGSSIATVAIGDATNGTHDVNVTTSTTFNAPVVLHGDNAIFNGNLATTGDAITINPANVDLRATTVSINSNGGAIEIAGVVTTSTGSNLELDAGGGTIEVNDVTTSGSQTYTTAGGTTTLNGATYSTVNGNIHFEGSGGVQLSVTGDVDFIANSGNIDIEGGVTGMDADLMVTARSGNVDVHDISANSMTLQSDTDLDSSGVPEGLLTINSSLITDGADIVLNPDGGAGVPTVATIVATDDLNIITEGGDFAIGVDPTNINPNDPGANSFTPQKLTAPVGKIVIDTSDGANTGGDAYVGDLGASGDIEITTASGTSLNELANGGVVSINGRARSLVQEDSLGSTELDFGTDIISRLGSLTITTRQVVDRVGNGQATLATGAPGGNGPDKVTVIPRFATNISLDETVVDSNTTLLSVGNLILDPFIRAPGTSIAEDIPRIDVFSFTDGDLANVTDNLSLELTEIDLLRIMGIPAVEDEGRVFLLLGGEAHLINDIASPDSELGEHEVTIDRVYTKVVPEALRLYKSLYVGQVEDEAGNVILQNKPERVREVLTQAWIDYRTSKNQSDPLDFEEYLRSNTGTEEALVYVNILRLLFKKIELLGLTSREMEYTKFVLLERHEIIPKGMSRKEFERLVLDEVHAEIGVAPVQEEIFEIPDTPEQIGMAPDASPLMQKDG